MKLNEMKMEKTTHTLTHTKYSSAIHVYLQFASNIEFVYLLYIQQ